MERPLEIYTDGACSPNPGRGGWAWIYVDKSERQRWKAGSEPHTTNNRMEMMAVIRALEDNDNQQSIIIFSDSKYVIDGITKWIHGWRRNNFKQGTVKNQDLWERMDRAMGDRVVRFNWVKGHSQNVMNAQADILAVQASRLQYNDPMERSV